MAPANSLLSEEQFLCSICLDVFTDPITTPCGHNYCKSCITHYWDTSDVCKCPLCAKTFYKRPEVYINTFISEIAHQFKSQKWKEEYEAKTDAEIQQMIRERQLKIEELKHSVELSKTDADREIADSMQVFSALVSCIERDHARLICVIEGKQKTTEKQAESLIKEMEKELAQLEKRSSELKQISNNDEDDEDQIQNVTPDADTPPPTKDCTKIKVNPSSYVGTLRTAVAQLEKTLSLEMHNELCDAELRTMQQYAVDVTLDPDTAHCKLILSEDGKQVNRGATWKNLPNNTERFSYCPSVLGNQSFSSGRSYYEVQVKGKTDWSLGVARESINRKGQIKLTPGNGYWTIRLRNGNEYKANADPPVLLPVRDLQKIGVIVDYEQGLVSFYDVEFRVHIYSFTGCKFTERLYPYFCPELNSNGKNSAPLIISPVNMGTHL